MHIAEGILTGPSLAATLAAGGLAVAWGAASMKKFVAEQPGRKPLLGMAGAFIFLVSLIPIPAFTGTTSHPCGTPLAGILLGPGIATALACLSLLLQAAFFAHGGFSSLGANTLTLGLMGAGSAWLVFKLSRRLGAPLWLAGALAGLTGDVMTYVAAGGLLSAHLAYLAPEPKYGMGGYLTAIYAAYLPTQSVIALGEMAVTGWALHAIGTQKPEVLEDLGVEGKKRGKGRMVGLFLLAGLLAPALRGPVEAAPPDLPATSGQALLASHTAQTADLGFPGMDEAVNEKIAAEAGAHARDPYINTEAWGDLWNFLLLGAGGLAGFVIGRNWEHLFGQKRRR